MKRLLVALLLTLTAAMPACADMYPDASNATSAAGWNLGIGNQVDARKYGADPTGVADSSSAINAALAVTVSGVGVNVRLPAGNYRLLSKLNIDGGRCLIGDGRGTTVLHVSSDFDPAADGVIGLTGQAMGTCVHNLQIRFAQPVDQGSRALFTTLAAGCTVGVGGTGCKYPPAIIATSGTRYVVSSVRVHGGWDGFVFTNNAAGGTWFTDIEMGALNTGLVIGQTSAVAHIKGWNHWPFGFSTLTDPIRAVYEDGATYAARIGRADGLDVVDFLTLYARVALEVDFTFGFFTNLGLDGHNASLEVHDTSGAGVGLQITNMYTSGDAPVDTGCKVKFMATLEDDPPFVTGNKKALITNFTGFTTAGAILCVAGGNVSVVGGFLTGAAQRAADPPPDPPVALDADSRAILVTGGNATVTSVRFIAGPKRADLDAVPPEIQGNRTTPLVDVTGGSIYFVGNRLPSKSWGTNVGGLSIAVDNPNNYVANNNTEAYPVVLGFVPGALDPPGFVHGYYDLGDQPFTTILPITPLLTPTFATPGNFVPVPDPALPAAPLNYGNFTYFLRGNFVDFVGVRGFDTNNYTLTSPPGPAGAFQFLTSMPPPTGLDSNCTVSTLSFVTIASLPGCSVLQSGYVQSIEVTNGGSGGANGPVTIRGTATSGSGPTKFEATGTIVGGVLQPGLVLTVPGSYTVNPTGINAVPVEPVVGGTGLVGATVSIVMVNNAMLQFPKVNSGAVSTSMSTTEVPPNRAGILFRVGGRHRIR